MSAKTPETIGLSPAVEAARHDQTLRDYTKVLFRQKAVIILTILTVSISTYIGLQMMTPVYEAEVKMLVTAQKQVDSPYYRDMYGDRSVEAALTQSEIVKSKPVLERTMAALRLAQRPLDYEKSFASPLRRWVIDREIEGMNMGRYTPQQKDVLTYRTVFENLKSKIEVEPIRDTDLFKIKVQDFSPVAAAIIANTISRSYVIFDLEQQFVELQSKYTEKNPIVVQMKENITKMEQNLNGRPLPNIDAIGPATVKIIEQSTPPFQPKGLPHKLMFILAVAMSVFLGLFLAFLFEYLDQTFHSKQDLENFIGVPVIACINKKRGFAEPRIVKDVSDLNRSPRAVSYRILANQILFMYKTKGLRSLLFTSSHPTDESSLIIANVAVFLSKKLGLKVLLMDANYRKAHLHKLFGKPNTTGLAQLLDGVAQPETAIHNVGERLDLLPTGETLTDPGMLLDADLLSKLMAKLRPDYDLILADGAVLRDFRDSAMVAPSFDGVILVVGESRVRRQVVAHSLKYLRDTHCRVVGAVMPNRDYLIPKFLYESV